MTVRFDDLEDFDSSWTSPAQGINVPRDIADVKQAIHVEDCPKCRGTGSYHGLSSYGHKCFKCGGTGKLSFKNSREQRERNRAKANARAQNAMASNLERFEKAHPEIAQWWNGTDFGFAVAMREAVQKYGDLTERQMASALRCVESAKAHAARQQERREEAAKAAAVAPAVDISAVAAALERGRAKGIRKPVLRLAGPTGAGFVFSRALDGGKNSGGVYVNGKNREYYGVILNGKFTKAHGCTAEQEADIIAACANPESSAIAYGRQFGICSCCGRELTNALSVKLGIGPICRGKFF